MKIVTIELESDILAASTANSPNTTIETAGQTVEERDMSASGFNHVWE